MFCSGNKWLTHTMLRGILQPIRGMVVRLWTVLWDFVNMMMNSGYHKRVISWPGGQHVIAQIRQKSVPLSNSFPHMELCAFETQKPPTFYTAGSSFRAVDQPAGSCVGSRVRAVLVSIRYFPLFPRPLLVTNLRWLADSQHERKHILQSGARKLFRNFPPF